MPIKTKSQTRSLRRFILRKNQKWKYFPFVFLNIIALRQIKNHKRICKIYFISFLLINVFLLKEAFLQNQLLLYHEFLEVPYCANWNFFPHIFFKEMEVERRSFHCFYKLKQKDDLKHRLLDSFRSDFLKRSLRYHLTDNNLAIYFAEIIRYISTWKNK